MFDDSLQVLGRILLGTSSQKARMWTLTGMQRHSMMSTC